MIPQPSYPLFEYLARFESVQATPYPLYYSDSWHIDIEAIVESVDQKTRAILVVNPNNPTGNFITQREWSKLLEICTENSLALICDEVFFDYLIDDTSHRFEPLKNPSCLCFFLNGLSKMAGLPQLTLSWILVQGPKSLNSAALDRLELIADTFLSVNTPVQEGLARILKRAGSIQSQIRNRIRYNYRYLHTALEGTSVDPLYVEGGWSVVLKLPAIASDHEWILRFLEDKKIIVHPGSFFGFPSEAFVVLSLLIREEEFRTGVSGILETVAAASERY